MQSQFRWTLIHGFLKLWILNAIRNEELLLTEESYRNYVCSLKYTFTGDAYTKALRHHEVHGDLNEWWTSKRIRTINFSTFFILICSVNEQWSRLKEKCYSLTGLTCPPHSSNMTKHDTICSFYIYILTAFSSSHIFSNVAICDHTMVSLFVISP